MTEKTKHINLDHSNLVKCPSISPSVDNKHIKYVREGCKLSGVGGACERKRPNYGGASYKIIKLAF